MSEPIKTFVLPVNDASLAEAARLLRAGQVVAMPTETVYGLAADATNAAAVGRIFEAKGRPGDNPLIVHIAAQEELLKVAASVPGDAWELADTFWPGPLTMVLPRGAGLAPAVSAGLSTVGIRLPAHEGARALIKAAGVPLAAPSANRSGRPSPTTAAHVLEDMQGRIPLILDGGPAPVGVESTVLSLDEEPVVLRPGFITAEEISEVLGRPVRYSRTATQPLAGGKQPKSPGVKYQHYAPKAHLTLVQGGLEAFAAYVAEHQDTGVWALCFAGEENALPVPALSYGRRDDPASQAEALFAALRRLDEEGARTVYVRSPAPQGVGMAVYNRLLRAAAFRVV